MRAFLIGVSTLAVMASATDVAAQTTPPTVAADTGLTDIIVTATRRETSLQNTALAVSAISGDSLKERGIADAADLTKLVPAIKIGTLAGTSVQVTIRGVGNAGGNAFADAGIGFNLDGVYLARTTGASGIFYDLNRVEVLKGPQGTLYGRNSTGGVVNVITKDPTPELGMDFTGEYGNANHIRATGAANIPLSDTLAVRVAGLVVKSDGFTPEGAGAEDTKAARIKLKFTPDPSLSLLLQADYTIAKDGPLLGGYVDSGGPLPPGVASLKGFDPFSSLGCGPTSLQNLGNPAVVFGAALPIQCDSFNNNTQAGVSGTINYDFGPATATLIVAHRRTTANYLHYGAGFPVVDDNRANPSRYTTAELRIASNGTGPFKWQAGTFYLIDNNRSTLSFNQAAVYQSANINFRTKSISGFGEGTYAVTDAVRFTLGARYTADDKSLSGAIVNPIGSNAPIPAFALPFVIAGNCPTALGGVYTPGTTYGVDDPARQFPFPNGTCRQPVAGQKSFNKFTWKAGIEADIGAHSLAYASVSTGFRSGGFIAAVDGTNLTPVGPGNSYRPETITAYTVGLKNRFFDNTLTFNLEGFYYDYKDKQLSHLGPVAPAGFNLVVDNAGAATLYGLEFEAVFKPTRNDIFNLAIQYEHTNYGSLKFLAEYAATAGPTTPPTTTCAFGAIMPVPNSPFNSALVDCSGKPVTYSPEWIANVGYHRIFDLGGSGTITFGASTQIQSFYWLGDEYIPTERQGATMVSDADLSWKSADQHLTITGYINNIENEKAAGAAFLSSGGARLAVRPPRTYGVRINVNF